MTRYVFFFIFVISCFLEIKSQSLPITFFINGKVRVFNEKESYNAFLDSLYELSHEGFLRSKLIKHKASYFGVHGETLTEEEAKKLKFEDGIKYDLHHYANDSFVVTFRHSERTYGKKAIPFEAIDVLGDTISLEKFLGQIIVINFWSLGCVPCIEEIPFLNGIVDQYQDEKVAFISFIPEHKDRLAYFFNKKGIQFNYRIVASSLYQKEYGYNGWPYHLIIGKDGLLVKHWYGGGVEVNTLILQTLDSLLRK